MRWYVTHSLSPFSRWLNWGKLGLLAAPVTAVFGQKWFDQSPHIWGCLIRSSIGYPCPSCGMTRAMLAISHGQWQTAWHYHAFSWLIFWSCLIITTHAGLELVCNRSIHTIYTKLFQQPRLYFVLGIGYFLYYCYRLYYQLIP